MKDFLKGLLKTIVWAAIFYAIACLVLYLLQGYVVYPGRSVHRGEGPQWQGGLNILSSQGFRGVQIEGPLEKGKKSTVHAIWSEEHEDEKRGCILWLHGRSESVTEIYHQLKVLRQLDTHVMAMEFRGYGPAGGTPSEKGILADAEALYDFMEKHESVDRSALFVGGYSLGANIAIQLAARKSPAGCLAVAPFTNLTDVLQEQFQFVPVKLLLKDKYDCMPAVRNGSSPVFLVHGTEDKVAPFSMAESIKDAGGPRIDLYQVDGAGHGDIFARGGQDLVDEMRNFLDRPGR